MERIDDVIRDLGTDADVKDIGNEKDTEIQKLQYQKMQGELDDAKQNRDLRKSFADSIFKFVVAYMAVAMTFVLLTGIDGAHFHLSDTILMALITTTTANMIGMLMIILKYLFPQK